MLVLLIIAGITVAALLLGAGVLHLLGRMGRAGRRITDACARAPLLDLLITYFTAAPMIVGAAVGGNMQLGGGFWRGAALGLVAGVIGQVVGVTLWTIAHELAQPEARRGPRIVTTLNRKVGPVRNFTAVWITAGAVPLFWLIRMAQYTVYPPLTWLVRLPKYDAAEWVNCSRHKFDGLVGHDRIWCLYCDWMTGVWSLGSEMLRNVESFWCPIRFRSDKKCANCVVDFPDIDHGWVAADGSMADVAAVLEDKYGRPAPDGSHPWFGHPVRLTVAGAPAPDAQQKPAQEPSDPEP
ncbi:MAG: hypothetical protein ACF8R7_18160 [Phycisphaerales bacterium JB039]